MRVYFYSNDSRHHIENTYNYITTNPNAIQIWTNRYTKETMHELLGIFGLQWMPTPTLSIGAKLNIPYRLSGHGSEQEIIGSIDHLGKTYTSSIGMVDYDLKTLGYESNPIEARVGFGFFLSESSLISIDMSIIKPKNTANYPSKTIFAFHLGGEYYLTHTPRFDLVCITALHFA